MPVHSMTGYATVQHTPATPEGSTPAPNVRVGLEIRAVNSRFLDLTFRLPDELRSQEPALRTLLTSRLKRGKVEVRAAVDVDASSSLPQPTSTLLQRMAAVQDLVQAWLPDAKGLSVSDALRLAGSGNAVQVDWQEVIPNLANDAVTALIDARQREGKRLAEMLQDRLQPNLFREFQHRFRRHQQPFQSMLLRIRGLRRPSLRELQDSSLRR